MNILDVEDVEYRNDRDNMVITGTFTNSTSPVATYGILTCLGIAFTLHDRNYIYHLNTFKMTDNDNYGVLNILQRNIKDITYVYAVNPSKGDVYVENFIKRVMQIAGSKLWRFYTFDIEEFDVFSKDLIGIDQDQLFVSLELPEDNTEYDEIYEDELPDEDDSI